MISKLFKLPRHRSFDYKPRYFDPVKEEFKQKLKEKQGINTESNDIKVELPIKERMSIKSNYMSQKYAERREDRIRIYIRVVTVVLLIMIVYMLFDVSVKIF